MILTPEQLAMANEVPKIDVTPDGIAISNRSNLDKRGSNLDGSMLGLSVSIVKVAPTPDIVDKSEDIKDQVVILSGLEASPK